MFSLVKILSTSGGTLNFMSGFGTNISNVVQIASYVFLAMGLYTIAKRRDISKPWLAWIPYGQIWMLGSISDQYEYEVSGDLKNRGKKLLIGSFLLTVLTAVMAAEVVSCAIELLAQAHIESLIDDFIKGRPRFALRIIRLMQLNPETATRCLFVGLYLMIPTIGVLIWMAIVMFTAYRDLFASCDVKNKKLYTALGIVLSLLGLGIVINIFVFVCCKKDEGMPPKITAKEPYM